MPTFSTDGGWGWMVVFGAFLVHMITDGVPVSFGIFLDELSDDFNESLSFTSWVGSFAYGVPCLAAPFASLLINKLGCRSVCVIGGFVSAFGCFLSFFSTSLFALILTFGVLSGIGSCLSSTSALVIVSHHFKGHRATATGLSVAGTGVGALVFSPLVNGLISLYTWRGTMLLLSGLFANMIVCGVLMRPVEPYGATRRRRLLACMENFAEESEFTLPDFHLNISNEDTECRIRLLGQLLTAPVHQQSPSRFNNKDNSRSSKISMRNVKCVNRRDIRSNFDLSHNISEENNQHISSADCSNTQFGSLTNLRGLKSETVLKYSKLFSSSLTFRVPNLDSWKNIDKICIQNSTASETGSIPSWINSAPDILASSKNRPPTRSSGTPSVIRYKLKMYKLLTLSHVYYSCKSFLRHPSAELLIRNGSFSLDNLTETKLRRIVSMPDLITMQKPESYTILKQNNSISTFSRSILNAQSSCCRYPIKATFFRNLNFNFFLLATLLLYFWCNVTYFFLAIDATQKGISNNLAAVLFSIMGASDMLGEILFGWSADQEYFSTILLYISAVLVCGLSTILATFATSFTSLVCYSVVFGFTMAANESLCTILVIEFVGFDHLINALGICLFCQGISSILGPPCIGLIIDVTESINVAFVCGGIGVICAGLIMIPIYVRIRKKPNSHFLTAT